jgi:cation diffusion facilitator CzcD-associated flavoprotein CzcO
MEDAIVQLVSSTPLAVSCLVVLERKPFLINAIIVLTGTKFETSKPMWLLGTKQNEGAAAFSRTFVESSVESPEIRNKLTPKDAFGCKRILVLDNYLPIFNQKNVELITEKPIRITETGVVSEDGREREVDVILNGTGILDNA